jgi:hypothetical protein
MNLRELQNVLYWRIADPDRAMKVSATRPG